MAVSAVSSLSLNIARDGDSSTLSSLCQFSSRNSPWCPARTSPGHLKAMCSYPVTVAWEKSDTPLTTIFFQARAIRCPSVPFSLNNSSFLTAPHQTWRSVDTNSMFFRTVTNSTHFTLFWTLHCTTLSFTFLYYLCKCIIMLGSHEDSRGGDFFPSILPWQDSSGALCPFPDPKHKSDTDILQWVPWRITNYSGSPLCKGNTSKR